VLLFHVAHGNVVNLRCVFRVVLLAGQGNIKHFGLSPGQVALGDQAQADQQREQIAAVLFAVGAGPVEVFLAQASALDQQPAQLTGLVFKVFADAGKKAGIVLTRCYRTIH